MQTGLAEAWRSRVASQAAENTERLEAENNLAVSLLHQGKAVEAEPMLRRLHAVMMRVHGAENPHTLSVAGELALSLTNQGKYTTTLSGSSARCLGRKSACSGPSIRAH